MSRNDKYTNSRAIRVMTMGVLCLSTLILANLCIIIMDGYTL